MSDTDKQVSVATPEHRAQSALGFVQAQAELTALAEQSKGITEITNKAGYDQCHASRMVLKNKRVDIQKTGKAAREDATKFSQAVIATEKQLIGLIEPEESRLQALQDAWDAAREAERVEAARIEAERVQKQKDALAVITGSLARLFGADVATLTLAAEQLESFDIGQFDDVFMPDAEKARGEALAAINKARDERLELDRQAAELKRLDEERQQREAAAAEERRKQQAEEDAERAERQRKEDEERKARQDAEDAERKAKAEAEQKERDRVKAEQDARQAELDKQAEEQRQRDAKAAQERLEAQEKADQEERDRKAAAAAEEAQRAAEAAEAAVQAATAREAMAEALDCLENRTAPLEDDDAPVIVLTIRKLTAVLAKEIA